MCTVSWNDFLKSAREFVQLSEALEDTWSLIQKDNEVGNTYLVFRQKINVSFDSEDKDGVCDDLEDAVVEHDPATASPSCVESEDLLEIEYHIVYSISYEVPVLYFRGYKSCGKPIGLDDAWKLFRGKNKTREDMLSTLTQSDHPVLFVPFLSLHPCRTAEILSQMEGSRSIVLTFISLVGPYVRLSLKNEYGLESSVK